MAYVVSLLPEDGADPPPNSALERFCGALGRTGSVEEENAGRMFWRREQTRFELEPTRDREGKLREVDVALPYGAVVDEVADALKELFDAADEGGFRAFDPQLGRSVTKADVPSIASRFEDASTYHVQYAGLSEDARQGLPSATGRRQPPLVSPKAKALLVLFGLLVLVYVLFRVVILDPIHDAFAPAAERELDRPEGPPPGWLDRHPPWRG